MIKSLRILAPPGLAAAALLAGLPATLLPTGRVEPLDWLLPAFVAFAAMTLAAARHGRRPSRGLMSLYLALVSLPPLVVCALAATAPPWPRMAVLWALLALCAMSMAWATRRRAAAGWITATLCLLLLLAVGRAAPVLDGSFIAGATRNIGAMSALPLFVDHGARGDGLMDVGGRSPLLRATLTQAEPLDRLDADSLKAFDRLLLAQPRLLRPEELVALDHWVREGGQVMILADPLLHWDDGRALGDPRRAPPTSLLDPLLTHWGLALQPADVDAPVERRVLEGGALLQLAGASRFTLAKHAPCTLAEGGLIARCRIGRGQAVLIADADWINDSLWTLAPAHPRDPRFWTSDAVPTLDALMRGAMAALAPGRAWLTSQQALVSALRWALALILLLGLLLSRQGPAPTSTHDPPMRARGRRADSGEASPDSA